MFPNLEAEMKRKNVTRQMIAQTMGVRYATIIEKLNGKYDFKLKEAQFIRNTFFPEYELTYLFSTEPVKLNLKAEGSSTYESTTNI